MAAGARLDDGSRARDQQWVLLSCETCGRPFQLKIRRARELLAGTRSARCSFCISFRAAGRDDGSAGAGALVVDDELRRWWLERFSLDEIRDMALAAWGHPDSWSQEWRAGFVFTLPGSGPMGVAA